MCVHGLVLNIGDTFTYMAHFEHLSWFLMHFMYLVLYLFVGVALLANAPEKLPEKKKKIKEKEEVGLHGDPLCYLPRRRRPGTGDIATPPVRLSVCPSVCPSRLVFAL